MSLSEGEIDEDQMMKSGFDFVIDSIKQQNVNEKDLRRRRKLIKNRQKVKDKKYEAIKKGLPILPIEYFPLNTPLFINGYPNEHGYCYPMLIKVTKKNFIEPKLYNTHLTEQEKEEMKTLSKNARRFYKKRFFLFSRFSKGIKLDEESWYSVIPESISKYITERIRKRITENFIKSFQVIDPFCGSGGIAIQLGLQFPKQFKASDIDPQKVNNIKHNMSIYGVNFQAEVLDFFKIQKTTDDQCILLLCPPWGGMQYLQQQSFDLIEDMEPNFKDILIKAFSISENLAIQLPRNIKIKQLITIFQEVLAETSRFSLEIEMVCINDMINQIFVYFGAISNIQYSQEINCLHQVTGRNYYFNNQDSEKKQALKQQISQKKIRQIYQNLYIQDQFDIPEELQKQQQVQGIKKKIQKRKSQLKPWSLKTFLNQNKAISQSYEKI